jgi:hypothetical protein
VDRSILLTCPACHGARYIRSGTGEVPCADCQCTGVECMDIALSLRGYLAAARDLPHLAALLAQTVELADERALAHRRAGCLGHANVLFAIAGTLAVIRDRLQAPWPSDDGMRPIYTPKGVELLTRRR